MNVISQRRLISANCNSQYRLNNDSPNKNQSFSNTGCKNTKNPQVSFGNSGLAYFVYDGITIFLACIAETGAYDHLKNRHDNNKVMGAAFDFGVTHPDSKKEAAKYYGSLNKAVSEISKVKPENLKQSYSLYKIKKDLNKILKLSTSGISGKKLFDSIPLNNKHLNNTGIKAVSEACDNITAFIGNLSDLYVQKSPDQYEKALGSFKQIIAISKQIKTRLQKNFFNVKSLEKSIKAVSSH